MDGIDPANVYELAYQLENQRVFFEQILNNLEIDIAVFDPDLRYEFINSRSIRDPVLRKWIIGKTDIDYCIYKNVDPKMGIDRQAKMKTVIVKKQTTDYEEESITATGEKKFYLRRFCPEFNKHGEVIRLVCYGFDITERRMSEENTKFQAMHDLLTELPNRKLFLSHLQQAIARAERHKEFKFAVLYLDLDRFKEINDTLGHHAGDQFLIETSRRIRKCLRGMDIGARLGGDEFAIYLDDINNSQQAEVVAERIRICLADSVTLGKDKAYSTVSIGIALYDSHYTSVDHILRDSDTAMYAAKKSGKNCFVHFNDQMHKENLARLHFESDFRQAWENCQFNLQFEVIHSYSPDLLPIVQSRIIWNHPSRGLVPQSEFNRLVEEIGNAQIICHWIISDLCRFIQKRKDNFGKEFLVCLNLPKFSYKMSSIINFLEKEMNTQKIPLDSFLLEIQESQLLDIKENKDDLLAIQKKGVRLILGSFGQGNSNLQLLLDYPIDFIKIENRSFYLKKPEAITQLPSAVIGLVKPLNIQVLAMDMSNQDQIDSWRKAGCQYFHGPYISKPCVGEGIDSLIAEGKHMINHSNYKELFSE